MLYAGVLFYLLLQFLRPQEFLPLIRGLPIVFATMVILLPLWVATLQHKKLLRTPQDLFIGLFWVMCIVSYLNHWPKKAYVPARDFGKIVLCYLFVAHVIDSRRKLAGAVWMVMLMLLLVALQAGEIQFGGTAGQYASVGMFDNRNDFAYAMAIMLPLATAFILKGDPVAKVAGAGVFLAGAVELVASQSRGGQLASMFGVGAVFYMLFKSKVGKGFMLACGLVVLAFVFTYSERLSTIGEYRSDRSAMGRVEIWATGLQLFKEHPFIGVGYRRFRDHCKRDSHSSYVRAISELGGIGLFVYIGILFFCLRDAYRITKTAPHPTIHVMALGLTGVLVGHIVGSLFQTRLYHTFVLTLFGVVSAMRILTDRERSALKAAGLDLAPPAGGLVAEPVWPAAPQTDELPDLWARSAGPGVWSTRLVAKKELLIIGSLTVLCWTAHKLFVMRSF